MRCWLIKHWLELLIGAGILLLSLWLRWTYWHLNPLIDRDSALYCHIATIWANTGDFNCAFREHIGGTAPLYIYLLKLGIQCGIPVIIWGRFLSFFFAGAFVLAFYFLGKQLFPGRRDGALICMALAGLHPVIGRWSVGLLREGQFLMLTAFAMAVFVRAFRTGGIRSAAWCGALLGAAAMTRQEAVELLLLGAIALLPWRARTLTNAPKKLLVQLRQPLFLLFGAAAAVIVIVAVTGIPLSFLTHQYLSKLDKIRLQ